MHFDLSYQSNDHSESFDFNSIPLESPVWLDQVTHFMTEHFADELTLDDLARSVNLSKFNFCRQFHRYKGMPPLKWLWTFRAILAREILSLPLPVSLQNVAFCCGFSSSSHFSRIFRELFNEAPSEYRERINPLQNDEIKRDSIIENRAIQHAFFASRVGSCIPKALQAIS